MRYLEVAVRCGRGAQEAVADLLTDLAGGVAVEDPLDVIRARASGRWDATDLEPGDPAWVTVKAYLPDAGDLEERRQRLDAALDRLRRPAVGAIQPPTVRWVEEADWATAWKQYFKPLRIGRRLLIVPSWEQADLQPGDVAITLDPGMAFGTGQHATTALCLRWLEALVQPGARVLDVGTGSGILAIAAARLGAGAVLACDLDPVAAAVAAENVARNGVAGQVAVACATVDQPPVRAWVRAGRPDLVVANLTAAAVQQVAPAVAAALAPGGLFLASGIIAGRRGEVVAALAPLGLPAQEVEEEDGWVAVLCRRA